MAERSPGRFQKWSKKLIALRRELHQYPELSGDEEKTAEQILLFCQELGLGEILSGIGGNGVALIFEGKHPGPTTLLRGELDALPIPETISLSYGSKHAGISHKCGHDGHMTILLAVACWIADHPLLNGRVVLLFQPAEEIGTGARLVVGDPAFASIQPDFAFALHNLPGYPLGDVLIKEGTFNCASKGLILKFEGQNSHTAHPEDGQSPAHAMCQLIQYLQTLSDVPLPEEEIAFATVVHAKLGEVAFGTSPGEAVVMATVRAETNFTLDFISNSVNGFASELALAEGLTLSVSERDHFEASINHPEAVKLIVDGEIISNDVMSLLKNPFRWSEDFGAISATCKGAMFGLGAGEEHPQLHHPEYDFPEGLIWRGGEIFLGILRQLHQFAE